MLTVSIPSGETEGHVRINGDDCLFKVANGRFSFRPVGADHLGVWDTRFILSESREGELTHYICANADGEGVVITPTLAEDGGIILTETSKDGVKVQLSRETNAAIHDMLAELLDIPSDRFVSEVDVCICPKGGAE